MAACEETREQMKKELSDYYVKDKYKFLSSKKAINGAKNGSQYDEIFIDSGKELFEKFKNSEYSKKKLCKKRRCPIKGRKSTLISATLKKISRNHDTNPYFNDNDQLNKEKIWKYSKGKSAINNKNNATHNKGDHIWGTNEVPRDDENGIKVIGSDTQWNIIPCNQDENINWKRITIQGYSDIKNIVYDFVKIQSNEPEILKLMEPEKREYYNKYKMWKKYCDSRNAQMYFSISTKRLDKVKIDVEKMLDELVKTTTQDDLQEFNIK
jgi:hypothetical protein